MEREHHFGFPDDFGRGLQCVEDGPVGHVAFAGGGEAAVERHLEAGGVGIAFVENGGGLLRAHGVAA